MNLNDLIPVNELCNIYEVKTSFIESLNDYGLIKITTIERKSFIEKEKIGDIEKIIRLHDELGVNLEGIDVICNLLNRIDKLQNELITYKNKLDLYE
ncbi:MAG: MerR family transcriptional regulator [Flavobacteriia bacterium]|nr:MAG: MerR family transcriptional regulator [Flavobacteriia bacterium]